jgi:hypothetical protein
MKKYLIKGALALFAGTFLFSCAEKESEYVPLAQQKSKAFDDVFKELYGDIDPYQDWGFSSGKIDVDPYDSTQVVEVIDLDDVAVTRTRAFGRGGTRTVVDANGNMWQDCPTVGTTEESDVVKYVEKLTTFRYTAPTGLTDYYVTHIHTGRDEYKGLNGGTPFRGSSKMDQLIIADRSPIGINDGVLSDASSWQHVYDFNAGVSVDFKGNMLMTQSGTKNFAYWNSLDSKWHDKWIAVDGASIDADKYGKYVYICFDYEATPKDDGNSYTVVSWNIPGNNPGETFQLKMKISGIWTLEQLRAQGYTMADNMTGMGAGLTFTVGDENSSGWAIEQYSQGDKYIPGDNVYTDWIIRLVKADGAKIEFKEVEYTDDLWWQLESGRVFCEDLGQSSREDLDFNDVVFDAIIFKNYRETHRWNVRWVDNVKKDSTEITGLHTDGLTYPIKSTKYYANVELLAAGGTLPVTIQSNMEGAKAYQVHDEFDAGITMMINTRDNNSTAFGSFEPRPYVQLGDITRKFEAQLPEGGTEDYDLSLFEIEYPSDGNAIEKIQLYVNFDTNQQIQQLTSIRGSAPRKFMAPLNTNWTSERKNISLAYPDFGAWVKGGAAPWGNVNTDYTYSGEYSPNGLKLPLVMKARRSYAVGTENEIWSGANKFGTTWNLSDVEANHPLSSSRDDIKFYPGDRLRFYGTQVNDDAWITVLIGDISPYFIDSEFPNYTLDAKGQKVPLPLEKTSCIEVTLDEWSCSILNEQIKKNNGVLNFQVQGRNFTLTQICRVLFD